MARTRRICAAVATAAALAPVWAPACAWANTLHTLPLQSLSSSGAERTLDWRGWRAKAAFELPETVDAQNLRIVLDAAPGDAPPAPHAWIEVRLNGSQPAILRPEPYPFAAQVDFPAHYLRPGRNEAVIEFISPSGACPAPADGAWALSLDASQLELTADAAAPASMPELESLLRSEFLSPQRIAIAAGDISEDDRAAFEAWAALAVGRRAPRTPDFATDGSPADLEIAFVLDPEADHASFGFADGGTARLEVRAAMIEAALALLRAWAEAAESAAFAVPAFDETWAPEPANAEFRLERRPLAAALHVQFGEQPEGAAMQLAINGREFAVLRPDGRKATSIAIPAHLLRPGLNRLGFAPRSAPLSPPEGCPPPGADPHLSIAAMRISQEDSIGGPDMFGFAAGVFGAPAHLVLPASGAAERAAQLRLLADIARRSGRFPAFAGISETLDAAHGAAVVIAARGLVPPGVLEFAPDSMRALLRGGREGGPFRFGSQAVAAPAVPDIAGAAAHFPAPGLGDVFIVTQADGADFAATIGRLVDAGMLAGFDGQVVGWSRNSVQVQDHGPWRPLPLRAVSPPGREEAGRTVLFLAVVGGLSLAWLLARPRPA